MCQYMELWQAFSFFALIIGVILNIEKISKRWISFATKFLFIQSTVLYVIVDLFLFYIMLHVIENKGQTFFIRLNQSKDIKDAIGNFLPVCWYFLSSFLVIPFMLYVYRYANRLIRRILAFIELILIFVVIILLMTIKIETYSVLSNLKWDFLLIVPFTLFVIAFAGFCITTVLYDGELD